MTLTKGPLPKNNLVILCSDIVKKTKQNTKRNKKKQPILKYPYNYHVLKGLLDVIALRNLGEFLLQFKRWVVGTFPESQTGIFEILATPSPLHNVHMRSRGVTGHPGATNSLNRVVQRVAIADKHPVTVETPGRSVQSTAKGHAISLFNRK